MDNSIYFDGRHYDALWPGSERQKELAFYLRRAQEFGGPVLELGCGTGQLTIPMAQAGIHMTGLDLSAPMLTRAKAKASEQNVAVTWVQTDCRDFVLGQQFGLIFFPANSLLHLLDWRDVQSCLTQVKKHLRPGGAFVFEIFNPNLALLTRVPDPRHLVGAYRDPDGRGMMRVTESSVYDAATQINHIHWHYQIEGRSEEHTATFALRMCFPQEIEVLLHYNGLDLRAKYGGDDETPFTAQSSRQMLVCVPK